MTICFDSGLLRNKSWSWNAAVCAKCNYKFEADAAFLLISGASAGRHDVYPDMTERPIDS